MELWTAAETLDKGNEGRYSLRPPSPVPTRPFPDFGSSQRTTNAAIQHLISSPREKKRPILRPRRTRVLYSAIRPTIISTSPQTPSQRQQSHVTFTPPSPPSQRTLTAHRTPTPQHPPYSPSSSSAASPPVRCHTQRFFPPSTANSVTYLMAQSHGFR